MTSTIPAKRKFGGVNTVTLFVGASRTAFYIHEDVLCTASPVFKAAFDSNFKESTDRTMELPDEDADVIEVFVSWLYYKTFSHEMFEIPAPDTEQEQLMQTARLFVFADKYDLGALRLSIGEDLFDLAANWKNKVPSFAVLEFIYANTRRKAIIRLIIADWFAWTDIRHWQAGGDEKWLYDIPEFGVDLAIALYNPSCQAKLPTPFEGSKSEYMQNFERKKTSP